MFTFLRVGISEDSTHDPTTYWIRQLRIYFRQWNLRQYSIAPSNGRADYRSGNIFKFVISLPSALPQTKKFKVRFVIIIVIQVSPMAMEDGQAADRQTWGNPVEFLMSCIAMSVGLGN